MATAKATTKTTQPTKAKARKRPPYVRARTLGKYTTMMKLCEEAFKKENPDREIYWAADPEHDKKFSKIPGRQLMGYELVDAQNVGIQAVMGDIGSEVRIGDAVMMSIPTDWREEIIAEKNELAAKEARTSRDAYERDTAKDMDPNVARPTGQITDHTEEITLRKED